MMTSRLHPRILLFTALTGGGIGGWFLHSLMRQKADPAGTDDMSKKTPVAQPQILPAARALHSNGSETADVQ